MTRLDDYHQFEGLHWETGSVRNYFAHRGVRAPHTNEAYTEAMLLGISGGVAMGYFSFAYEGYDPHVALLTRNTFDPFDTLLQRLGVPQTVMQTAKSDKAVSNLVDCLDNGIPAIVWADIYSLPYNDLPLDEGMWGMMPILVYGYDEAGNTVWIADRARVPLTVTTGELAAARGRVKKTKYRLLTLEPPDPDKLIGAVQLGIRDCISLFTEAPPRGSKSNFGFAAYQRWVDLLTKPKQKQSWANVFPPGRKMYAGLTTAFENIAIFGKEGGADRDLYADFLGEAGVLLGKPALHDVADQFRRSSKAWDDFGVALLPDDVPLLKETRELMVRRHTLFLGKGNAALGTIREINSRLRAIREEMSQDFPLGEADVSELNEALSEHILRIHDIELTAITALREAMA